MSKVLLLLMFAVLYSGYNAERPTSKQGATLVARLKKYLSFDHVVILCPFAFSNATGLDVKCSGYELRAQKLLKAFSKEGISAKVLHLGIERLNFYELDRHHVPWLGIMSDHIAGRFLSGRTPLILVPRSDECHTRVLQLLWMYFVLINTSELNFLWLQLLDERNLTMPFKQIPFTMDVSFMVAERRNDTLLISEMFQVAFGKVDTIHENKLGELTSEVLEWNTTNFYERRNNLREMTVYAITQNHPPFCTVKEEQKNISVTGLVGEVWKVLEDTLKFTTVLTALDSSIPESELVKKCHPLYLILRDVGQVTYKHSPVRFTAPLYFNTLQVYIRHPGTQGLVWDNFLAPFTRRLWFVVVTTLVINALCMTMVRSYRSRDSLPHAVSGALLAAVGVMSQQSADSEQRTMSSRIMLLMMHLLTAVVIAGYSAAIIFSLALRSAPLPFSDIEGLVRDGSYYSIAVEGSAEIAVALNSSDPALDKLFQPYLLDPEQNPRSLPQTTMDGLLRICDYKEALLTKTTEVNAFWDDIPCYITALPNFHIRLNMVFPVSVNQPWVRLLNYHINLMRSRGLMKRHLRDSRISRYQQEPIIFYSVSFMNVVPLLTLLLTGCALALLVLRFECWIVAFRRREAVRPWYMRQNFFS